MRVPCPHILTNSGYCLASSSSHMDPGGGLPGEEQGLAPGAWAWDCDFEGNPGLPCPSFTMAESWPGILG